MKFKLTRRQDAFVRAESFEVLFGGAAGGGKSYAQVYDAVRFASMFPGSRQLILRRTMPELQRTLINTLLKTYPRQWLLYSSTHRTCVFPNASMIQFGFCRHKNDVYQYQSAEYDVIRFDELTHFPEEAYIYLISRIRGANNFPKQIKSATNPGGIGHEWVKRRFIDIGAPDREHGFQTGNRIFLPARVEDNLFLMASDPGYKKRLENLGESEKRALLYGDWELAEGRYFSEWNRALHVVAPFEIPEHWQRFFSMDYGLDMLAAYWIAMDEKGYAYVYRELYEPGHIVSEAARRVLEEDDGLACMYFAPPDLWNRRQDSGRSVAEAFLEYGLTLTKAPAARVAGWLSVKEWLKPHMDEKGKKTAGLRFFENCIHIIRCLPALNHSPAQPGDCARDPHELTHGPDAIRYFAAAHPFGPPTLFSALPAGEHEDSPLNQLMDYRG